MDLARAGVLCLLLVGGAGGVLGDGDGDGAGAGAPGSGARGCPLARLPVELTLTPAGVLVPGEAGRVSISVRAIREIDDLTLRVEATPGITALGPLPSWRGRLEAGATVTVEAAIIVPTIPGRLRARAFSVRGHARSVNLKTLAVGPEPARLALPPRLLIDPDGTRSLLLPGIVKDP